MNLLLSFAVPRSAVRRKWRFFKNSAFLIQFIRNTNNSFAILFLAIKSIDFRRQCAATAKFYLRLIISPISHGECEDCFL